MTVYNVFNQRQLEKILHVEQWSTFFNCIHATTTTNAATNVRVFGSSGNSLHTCLWYDDHVSGFGKQQLNSLKVIDEHCGIRDQIKAQCGPSSSLLKVADFMLQPLCCEGLHACKASGVPLGGRNWQQLFLSWGGGFKTWEPLWNRTTLVSRMQASHSSILVFTKNKNRSTEATDKYEQILHLAQNHLLDTTANVSIFLSLKTYKHGLLWHPMQK